MMQGDDVKGYQIPRSVFCYPAEYRADTTRNAEKRGFGRNNRGRDVERRLNEGLLDTSSAVLAVSKAGRP